MKNEERWEPIEKTYLFEIRCIVCGGLLATLVNGSDTYSMNREKSLRDISLLHNIHSDWTPGIVFLCNCGEKNNLVIK